MTVWCYTVAQDHGFAPNPFYGVLTLATCKPSIRKNAQVGDWVLGMGASGYRYRGRAVFFMRVTEITSYDAYWRDPRFALKKPVVNGSFMQRFGDNIYHRDSPSRPWIQADSRHSKIGGVVNEEFLKNDTGMSDRVLLSEEFTYWGEQAPTLPASLEAFTTVLRNHVRDFSAAEVAALMRWFRRRNETGWVGDPFEWRPERLRRWK
ncbi:hypothetical protein [Methylobacterium oryzae]|uniref:Nucleotide modification associated domain-containing protein n=1 Tax=Methylobacterium oryzae TaxID=334852 RepID=A0ABU7TQY1_9HYPH